MRVKINTPQDLLSHDFWLSCSSVSVSPDVTIIQKVMLHINFNEDFVENIMKYLFFNLY